MASVSYVVFDLATGKIFRSGRCDESLLQAQRRAKTQGVAIVPEGTRVEDEVQRVVDPTAGVAAIEDVPGARAARAAARNARAAAAQAKRDALKLTHQTLPEIRVLIHDLIERGYFDTFEEP